MGPPLPAKSVAKLTLRPSVSKEFVAAAEAICRGNFQFSAKHRVRHRTRSNSAVRCAVAGPQILIMMESKPERLRFQNLVDYRIRVLLVGSALPRVTNRITAATIPSTTTAKTMFNGVINVVALLSGVASGVGVGGGAFF